MQINVGAIPALLNLRDVKFVNSLATNTITLYYDGSVEATITFSAADASYGLQKWFVGQIKVALMSELEGYILPPLPEVPGNDAVTISSIAFP